MIGSYYPDEADGHGFTGANLPAAQGLRFLTLTNHFYSAAAPLPGGKGMYPGLVAKADVVGFDLYPLQVWCRRSALPDVAAAQRELVRLAAGKPTFQWIETTHMQCPFGDPALAVTPATVRAESWLALVGGAHGLGFFPIGWTRRRQRRARADGTATSRRSARRCSRRTRRSRPTRRIEAAARSLGGAFYVFAVNPTYAPVTATIRAPGLDGRPLQVLDENRTVTPAGRRVHGRLRAARGAPVRRRARVAIVRPMELRTLGRTGVRVTPLCLGTMMFGAWGNTDHDESIRIIHRALDAGINFVDTADVYAQGESEEIVGKALAGGKRDQIVLATKVHGQMGDDPNQRGNSRRWIIQAVEDSLRRLGTDWIDLYQIHRPDPSTDIDETLGALTDLVRAGQDPLLRQLDLPGARDRRGAVDGRAARPRALRLRAAALLAARPRDRGRRAAGLRALRDGRDHLEPARAAAGSAAATARAEELPTSGRAAADPASASTCRCPATRPSSRRPSSSRSSPRSSA